MRTIIFLLGLILIASFLVLGASAVYEIFNKYYAAPVYSWVISSDLPVGFRSLERTTIIQISILLIFVALFLVYKIISPKPPAVDFSADTINKVDDENIYLLLRRSQGRTLFGRVIFHLIVRAYIPRSSEVLIMKYRLRNQLIYSSKSFKNLATDAVAHHEVGEIVRKINPIVGLTSMAKGVGLGLLGRFAMKIKVKHLVSGKVIKCRELHEMMEGEKASSRLAIICIPSCKLPRLSMAARW